MPSRPKVGIIACSGEEIAEGTVTRLAALEVLHELRRGQTVTICLPLFLAGGEGERAFAKLHPTITVDGCDLRCAAQGTEAYSEKPAASIVVTELAAEHGISGIAGRRCLNQAGRKAVELTARRLASLVDEVLGKDLADTGESPVVGCSCGSGVPAKVLTIAGQSVEVVALPLVFDQLREAAPSAEDLLRLVKVYNYVAPEAEAAWLEVLPREFAAHCGREVPG
jgi:uncharacterized metal-binding protein